MPVNANLPAYENQDDHVNLIDYIIVILKWKKIVLLSAIAAIVLSGIYIGLKPNVYTATARILIPQKSGSGMPGIISGMEGDLLNAFMSGSSSALELYVGILESRTIADEIIKKYDLKNRYGKRSVGGTRRTLSENTKIENGDNQIISISVKDNDPKISADMANTYTDELDRINKIVNVTTGHLKRVFLEKRQEKVRQDLIEAENRLKEFQEKHHLIAIEEQARETIEGAAKLKGEIISAQTELEVYKKFGTDKNTMAIQLKSKIDELNHQLALIETGYDGKSPQSYALRAEKGANIYIPLRELPELGVRLARLARETKIQEELFKLVSAQYEMAKIEEAKDINTIQILDRAVAPDAKSGPSRLLFIALSGSAGLFIGVIVAFLMEFMEILKIREPDRYLKLIRAIPFRQYVK